MQFTVNFPNECYSWEVRYSLQNIDIRVMTMKCFFSLYYTEALIIYLDSTFNNGPQTNSLVVCLQIIESHEKKHVDVKTSERGLGCMKPAV